MKSQYDESELLYLEEYQALKKIPAVDPKYREEALNHLIDLYEKWQKPQLAEEYRQKLTTAVASSF